jgi:general secretion pathway protein M
MSSETFNGSGGQATLRQQSVTWWNARTPRERQAVLVVVFVLVLFLLWSVFVQPAMRTIREAPLQLDRLDVQTQQMQRASTEVEALRGATRVSPQQAAAALKAATDRLGPNAKLNLQGDRATLTISGAGVNAVALRAWLSEARRAALQARTPSVEPHAGCDGLGRIDLCRTRVEQVAQCRDALGRARRRHRCVRGPGGERAGRMARQLRRERHAAARAARRRARHDLVGQRGSRFDRWRRQP